ncbi:hypothetical protein OOU_Y34scaffold00723g6 [Pyricularia oryzae Y34]|uniref:Zn(2)-C6 fungal-type domain-containing protein n=1 Tax=Pyricularia oryzae (strain Y34) TaxID=1143189 RepID=A0AA97PHW6_PYRO3|nr:hypothetical protein OOU_Y34scaffold00723g6 [Pyricularia oryzae Y34]
MHSAMVACRHQNKAQAGVGTAAKGFGREVDRYPYLGKLGTRWDGLRRRQLVSGSIMFELYCSAVSIPRHHQVEDAMEQNMPPIRKQRSQLTPTACVRCRIKCTGEPQGCRTCVNKDAECIYPTSLSSSSLRQPPYYGQQIHAATTTTSAANAALSGVHSGGDARFIHKEARGWRNMLLMPDATGGTMDLDLSQLLAQQATEVFDSNLDHATEFFMPPYHDCLPSPSKEQDQRSPKRLKPSAKTGMITSEDSRNDAGTRICGSASATDAGNRHMDGTTCFEKLLEAFEAIALETAQHKACAGSDRVSLDQTTAPRQVSNTRLNSRLLTCQTHLIHVGETLLECPQCMIGSLPTTMLANLAETILDSIDLVLSTIEQGSPGPGKSSRSSRSSSSSNSIHHPSNAHTPGEELVGDSGDEDAVYATMLIRLKWIEID